MLNWLFPKKCFRCQKQGNYLCLQCKKLIVPLRTQFYPQKPLDGLVSLYRYQYPLNRILKSFKYHQVRELEKILIDLAIKALNDKKIINQWKKEEFIFLPLPLFSARRLWRGFDQSEVILKGICQYFNLLFNTNILKRERWTKEQAKLNSKERLKNIKNAFIVSNKEKVKGKNFVIFDDVWTTGATLKEGAKALKSAGADQVWGLTLCR